MNETYTSKRHRQNNAPQPEAVHPDKDDFQMIRDDIKASWRAATRALNWCENSGAHDTAANVKDAIILLSKTLEECETMASV